MAKKFVITNRLGPTDKMFEFYGLMPGTEVVYKEIIPDEDSGSKDTIFIGFEGEFSKPELTGVVVDKYRLPDEVVYRLGQTIWAIKK